MLYIIYTIHVVICLFLIMVVLLQQGSGADLSVFGGGGTQTAFGARSATSLLHKLTVAGFIGFILTTIAFGFLKSGGPGSSVMSEVGQAVEADGEDASTVAPETENALGAAEPEQSATDDPATEPAVEGDLQEAAEPDSESPQQ